MNILFSVLGRIVTNVLITCVAGMNFCSIVCSNRSSNSLILGMVWIKYVSLLLKPLKNSAYADCGSVTAIFVKNCRLLFKLITS